MIPSRAGYPTATLVSITDWRAPANYHLLSDMPENLDYATVADATRLAYEVIAQVAARARREGPRAARQGRATPLCHRRAVPEGDTIHRAADRIRTALAGRVPERILTPQPRHRLDRWPQKLAGRALTSVDAHGKHLFLRFEGGLTLHSHLRMTGSWAVRQEGAVSRRSMRHAWLLLARAEAGRRSSTTGRCWS